uniref:Putative ovule protein n=1 Tax=Solanum chacoense TaxID=4108 RepID=A0A0V0HG69_SOLCH
MGCTFKVLNKQQYTHCNPTSGVGRVGCTHTLALPRKDKEARVRFVYTLPSTDPTYKITLGMLCFAKNLKGRTHTGS